MAILTTSGRVAMAKAIAEQPIYMCWGKGNETWPTDPPQEGVEQIGLLDPVGYKKHTTVSFCEPNLAGEIVHPSGRYSLTQVPTRHLHFRFIFDQEDGLGETIRELGVMIGTVSSLGLPEGQTYFSPTEIEDAGLLLFLEHRAPLYIGEGVRESFEFVISF